MTRTALRARQTGAFEPLVCCLIERRGPFLQTLEAAQVPVYAAPPGWARRPSQLLKLAARLRTLAPDIIHSQVNFTLGQQFLAARLAGRSVFCVTERSEYVLKGMARLRRIIQLHLLLLGGAHYSANSASTARHVARQGLVSPARLAVLPNGITLLPPDAEVRQAMRAQLGWEAHEVGLGYVSRLGPGKGQDLFIQAIQALRAEGLPVRGCLLGDGPERPALESQVCALGLEQVVTLTGTVLNVEDYLQAFDAVALFSVREGMPNAILEAMAAGKAVIGTGVGGMPEMFAQGQAGIVVERTVEDITAGLRSLAQDAAWRTRLGEQARQQAERLYGAEQVFARLVAYYREVSQWQL